MTVPFVYHIRSLTTNFPTVFGGCVRFHINFHNQDIAIIVKERYSEKFRCKTKRPLEFLDESTVRLLHEVELLTGRIRVASRSLKFQMRRKTT